MILSILSQKGGVSKSTLTINLAHYFSQKNLTVAVVDCDQQGSTTNFFEYREKEKFCDVFHISKNIKNEIAKLAQQYDLVLVDNSPKFDSQLSQIIEISDKILILTKCSQFDFFACSEVVELVKTYNKTDKARFLLTQLNNVQQKLKNNMLDSLKNYEIEALKTSMSLSAEYVNSINNFETVFELKNAKKVAEIQLIAKEIESI